MQSFSWYIKRLRSMGPSEIAWRVRGVLRDQLDIVRVPLGLIPGLPKSMRDQSFGSLTPGFNCSPIRKDEFGDYSSRFQIEWRERLIGQADSVCKNNLSYFDLVDCHHGNPFQWHRDHSAEIDAPVRLSVFTDYRDFKTFGDCKLVWEPNRHHQFVVLARAWVVTGNDRYAKKILELMSSWIQANPFGYGMNWKSPLEHGVRIINWIWALDLIRGCTVVDDDSWNLIRETLFRLMWDSQRRYSQGSSANNHLIGEVAGVFFGACYFEDLPERGKWIRESQEILEREIQLQTYDSGCTREHAFGYQFFVIQFFHQCLNAGDRSGFPFSEAFRDKLHVMYRFMREITSDTGDIPNLNDRDDGYVVNLGATQREPLELVSAGAGLFQDDFLAISPGETSFWLFGETGQTKTSKINNSSAFDDAGYYLLRGADASVFFDAAQLGYGPIAAHGHADCLSFTLSLGGTPIIIDSGTYDYFTHPGLRDYFRSTAAHNTAEIDGQNQSDMQGPFLWGRRAEPRIHDWTDSENVVSVDAEHSGYMALADPVTHRRRLSLDKEQQSLTIIDQFDCEDEHTIKLHLHFAPEITNGTVDESTLSIMLSGMKILVHCDDCKLTWIEAGSTDDRGWTSPSYHTRLPSPCLEMSIRIKGPKTIKSRITWKT